MPFTKQRFGLYFSMPLDAQDWQNLAASRVKLVMLNLEFADAATLQRVAGMNGGVKVILRVQEGRYYDELARARIRQLVLAARQSCGVEAVIVGNEPEHPFGWEYGSPSWGQDYAYRHRQAFDAMRVMLQREGVRVVSPATTMRSISEHEAPQPGRVTWREIMCLPDATGGYGYLSADGCGVHLYAYGWQGPVDELRLLFALKQQAELWHRPLWIDEVGVADRHSSQMDKMRAYINNGEILMARRDGRQQPTGARVECLIPFVSNGVPGDPPAWMPQFLLRDHACYQELGRWMAA